MAMLTKRRTIPKFIKLKFIRILAMAGYKKFLKTVEKVYEKEYKKLLIIPISLILFFSSVILYTKITTGEFFYKDVTLKGGTGVTIYSQKVVDLAEFDKFLENETGTDVEIKKLINPITHTIIGYDIQLSKEIEKNEIIPLLEQELGEINETSISIGTQSPQIASSFFRDAFVVITVSFILIGIVTYYYFRNIVRCFTILISTIGDIICILGVLNLMGVKLSTASIGAFLMIIAFSTDSDVIIATYMLKKKEGKLIERIKRGIKTCATMEISAGLTFGLMLLLSNVDVIKNISLILFLDTIFDTINTWIFTTGLQRIQLERK